MLVGHSWAGMVITEAGASERVRALVYVTAFAPEMLGQRIIKTLSGPAWPKSPYRRLNGFHKVGRC